MIVFDLKCTAGHVFEAWFQNSQSFEDQKDAHEIVCPACGDTGISKAAMAPNISVGQGGRGDARNDTGEDTYQEDGQPAAAVPAARMPEAPGTAVREMVEALRSHIRDNCDYVGSNFAEEARKIHYGESEDRGIYGEATAREAVELNREGIKTSQFPFPLKYDS